MAAQEKLIKLSGIIFLFALMVSSPVASHAQSAVEWLGRIKAPNLRVRARHWT